MTKLKAWVLCFPYFKNNSIAHDLFFLKKGNKINNVFVILVMIFCLKKIINGLWKPSNGNRMFSNL